MGISNGRCKMAADSYHDHGGGDGLVLVVEVVGGKREDGMDGWCRLTVFLISRTPKRKNLVCSVERKIIHIFVRWESALYVGDTVSLLGWRVSAVSDH